MHTILPSAVILFWPWRNEPSRTVNCRSFLVFFTICTLGGSWGKFFMSDWSLTGPFWSLIAPESCSKVSLSIFYCRKVLQPIKDLCYKISLSDNIFMISKLDPAMFFFILLDSSKIKTSKKLILLTQLSVAWKWSLS